ncbi:MAG: sigma 54-interacting transcriptional regulator [Candidatus Bathyarchaeota archaeon]|nr:sigma 54-interacting transcriptional regulator [Candidatus Bathyarchaeota archaeon]
MEKENIKILIIEDNPADLRLVQEMLKASSQPFFEISHTEYLEQGIKKLQEYNFDAVLLDLNLPDSFGLEGLEQIIRYKTEIPIIVLTGTDDKNLGMQAIQERASDYLVKGKIDTELLIRTIRYAIEREKINQLVVKNKIEEIRLKTEIAELENIVKLFDKINTGVVLVDRKGIIKYANERIQTLVKIKTDDNIKDYLNLAKFSTVNFVNEIMYIEKVKQSFLVSRERYRIFYLYLLEPLNNQFDKIKKINATLAPFNFVDIVGLKELKNQALNFARQNVDLLIQGETGTGKELFASAIHNASPRAGEPFVAVNCVAIPQTLFESELFGYKKGAFTDARKDKIGKIEFASGGTLFFDEIGDMPLAIQAKLLRVLEDKTVVRLGSHDPVQVDIRFIFATNRNLEKMVKNKEFREDLYYRINLPLIRIPALRERKGEIVDLVKHFIKKFNIAFQRFIIGVSAEALERLIAYDYPGNVRELEGILKDAYLSCPQDEIRAKDLKLEAVNKSSIDQKINEYKAKLIYELYLAQNRDIEKTAKALNVSTRQVYRYLNLIQSKFLA